MKIPFPGSIPCPSPSPTPATRRRSPGQALPSPAPALAAALLGFFVITLDTLVVNVALPSIQDDLGGGVTGLQWVMDGYTLMFAALLLSSGPLRPDRRAPGVRGRVRVVHRRLRGLRMRPHAGRSDRARLLQGLGAAVTLPASMALLR